MLMCAYLLLSIFTSTKEIMALVALRACHFFFFVCKHNKAKHFAWLMIKLCRDVEWGPITIDYNLA